MARATVAGILAACLGAGLCLAGCYSSGVKRFERSMPTLGVMRDALSVARSEVGDTLLSLNELAQSDGNLDAPYRRFMGDCESLEAELSYLRRLRSEISARRETFARERLRDASDEGAGVQGRAAAMARLAALESGADAVRDLFNPWFSNLQDIGRDLEAHLDLSRLSTVAEKVREANEGASPLQAAIDELIASIDEVAVSTAALRMSGSSAPAPR